MNAIGGEAGWFVVKEDGTKGEKIEDPSVAEMSAYYVNELVAKNKPLFAAT